MMRSIWTALVQLFLIAFFSLPVFGQVLSVRNQPYQGEVLGRGTEALVRLDQMAEALDLPAEQQADGWTLAGVAIPVVEQDGQIYVQLSDLEPAGVTLVLNTQLNTLDLYRARATAKSGGSGSTDADQAWSSGSAQVTMVYFGAQR